MKKIMIMAMMTAMTVTASAMSYSDAKNEALFLSDKMAYELNLTLAQYEEVYEINLDYLMSVNGRNDVLGKWWKRRNVDLGFVLDRWQYDKYTRTAYFYRPITWSSNKMNFGIYDHYGKNHFYNNRPKSSDSYHGGNNHKHDNYCADRHSNNNGKDHRGAVKDHRGNISNNSAKSDNHKHDNSSKPNTNSKPDNSSKHDNNGRSTSSSRGGSHRGK